MGRVRRVDVGEMVYHALNRANFRSRLFKRDAHYEDFLGIVEETLAFVPMRILAYCLMPNHWHLVLHPRGDGDLARFLQRLTLTHTQRYHARTRTVGYGHLYQGRYKSLPVESDSHFLALVRYVERNAKRAALVKRAEDWRWSSVHVRLYGNAAQKKILSRWPTPEPPDYLLWLNHSQAKEEVENIRYAIKRSRPYGSEKWVAKAVAQFGLETTIRNPWRPGKDSPSPPTRRKGTRPPFSLNSYDPAYGVYNESLSITHGQTEFNAFKAGAGVNHEHGFGPNETQKIWNYIRANYPASLLPQPVFDPTKFLTGGPDD